MPSRQLDEETIFHTARKIDNLEARAEYLDQICADDANLRSRVEALLDVHEQEGEFLKSAPALGVTQELATISEGPGQQIGRYKLLQKIGEGGFGVVYMAEQQRPVRRKVALKIIKPGMDSKAVIARFEAERQALALMDHLNISRVLDGGATESGRPYFVMELVRGVPITEYCDKNSLSMYERLRLFATVCQAVQHAHQKGIIHRDLKPSNVLITLADDEPVVKVIDFGVAKALNQQLTEKTLFTALGHMIGTPQYMSPEQAEMSCLDVDTRSDIYSLGVLLYELLTGTTPLEGERLRTAGYAEMQRLIREEEPPKPSTRLSTSGEKLTIIAKHRGASPETLHKTIRGDLDWIVMKALEKDRARRYANASNFSDDLKRYLSDEPIDARSPSSAYRMSKFVRRNKGPVAVTSIVALTLLVGTGIAYYGLIEATAEATRADAAAIRAKASADENLRLASELEGTLKRLQGELLDRAVADALAGDLAAAEDSLTRARQAKAPAELVRVIESLAYMYGGRLNQAIEALESLKTENETNLTVLAACCWAHFNAGHFQEYTELWERIAHLDVEQGVPRDDYERILLAQTKVFAVEGKECRALISDLDDIISRHPRWGIAYAIRSEAKTQLAKQSRRLLDLEDAQADADMAERYHPDNPFVLVSSLLAYVTSIELARHQKSATTDEMHQLEERAARVSVRLEDCPDYYLGRNMRLHYYYLMEREEAFEDEYRGLLADGIGGDQPLIGRLLVEKDATALCAFFREHPNSFAAETAVALRHVIDGEPTQGLLMLDGLIEKYSSLDQRFLMLDIALVAQRPGVVRGYAKQFLEQLPSGLPAPNRWAKLIVQYYAGKTEDSELLDSSGPFHVEGLATRYAIGMWTFATAQSKEDLGRAREHLAECANGALPGSWTTVFSKTYLQLLDEGRLPAQDVENASAASSHGGL
jgi:serine/threonine protein kinase